MPNYLYASGYYVDAVGGSDVTGDGSIGSPWASVQHALDNITQGSKGDQINIKSSGAQVLSSDLSLTTYGTPTIHKPLVFRGYASTANDGGIGELDGDGATSIFLTENNGNSGYVHFWDMKLGNTGTNKIVRVSKQCTFVHCEFHTSAAGGNIVETAGIRNLFIDCWFHNLNPTGFHGSMIQTEGESNALIRCVIETPTDVDTATWTRPLYIGQWAVVDGCIFFERSLARRQAHIIQRNEGGSIIQNNTFYSRSQTTAYGTECPQQIFIDAMGAVVMNNVFRSDNADVLYNTTMYAWKFTGGSTPSSIVISGPAARHEIPEAKIWASAIYELGPETSLSQDPFQDPVNGNFQLKESIISEVPQALPSSWPFVADNTTNYELVGAIQPRAGAGESSSGEMPDPSQVLEGVEFGNGLVGTMKRVIAGMWR